MNPDIKRLEERIKQLETKLEALGNSSTIPFNVDRAFRTRLASSNLATSSKSASSEDEAIDEAGIATHNVLKRPDGYLQADISGIKYIPFYD